MNRESGIPPASVAAPYPSDIDATAWTIAAMHLTRGQKDVTKMIAEAILGERRRCAELVEAALGPEAELAVFVADPNHDW